MGLTRVFPLMTMESVARLLTDRTRVNANEFRVISQAHRVNTSNTLKGRLKLCESLTIRPTYMLAGVFERVAESSGKTRTLKFQRPNASPVRLRWLDKSATSTVFTLPNAHPCLQNLRLRKVRADIDAVGMKVGVVALLFWIPSSKLIAPERKRNCRDEILRFAFIRLIQARTSRLNSRISFGRGILPIYRMQTLSHFYECLVKTLAIKHIAYCGTRVRW